MTNANLKADDTDPAVDAIHALILDRLTASGLQLKKPTKQIRNPSSALRHELFRAFNTAVNALEAEIPRGVRSSPVQMNVSTASDDEGNDVQKGSLVAQFNFNNKIIPLEKIIRHRLNFSSAPFPLIKKLHDSDCLSPEDAFRALYTQGSRDVLLGGKHGLATYNLVGKNPDGSVTYQWINPCSLVKNEPS